MSKMMMEKLFLIFLIQIFVSQTECMDLKLDVLLQSGLDISSGFIKGGTSLLPSSFQLFSISKNLIAGYPLKFAAGAINTVCSVAVNSHSVHPRFTPDISKMHFQLRTPCYKYNFSLQHMENMFGSPAFDPKKKVVILATGWTTTVNDTKSIDVLAKAYICRGDYNFVAVDAASFVDTLYTWSAYNSEIIGEHIAVGLEALSKVVPIQNIHLIGHSLGAHIMGAAGRHFTYRTGELIPRITGLDPANPCFNEGQTLSGLSRGDAKYIDIIHSNPGILGKRDPVGDADFYPGGVNPLPVGCYTIVCAHARSWWFYAETVYPGNEYNFMAKRCSSLARNLEDKCPGKDVPMGYASTPEAKGNYFLDINLQPPFGKNGRFDWTSLNNRCGQCKTRDIKKKKT